MKHMKKFMALFAALALVLAMAVPAFAATATTGSITINKTVAGTEYKVYRIFDLESYDSANNKYSYKLNSEWDGFKSYPGASDYFNINANGYVEWKKDTTEAEAKNFAALAQEFLKTHTTVAVAASDTATGTSIEFTGLPLGYYLIDTSLGSLCILNTTKPDIEVDEKNSTPSVDKKIIEGNDRVAENDAGIGDVVYYETTINVTAGNTTNYVLHDTMSGLDFNDDVKVFSKNKNAELVASDYTVSKTDFTDDCTFEITFNDSVLVAGDVLTVTYSGTVNSSAVIGNMGNPNKTHLDYGNKHTPEAETKTYVWEVNVFKYTGDNTPLKDAQFVFYRKNGETKEYAQIAANGKITGWTQDETQRAVLTTPDTGKLQISGLDAGTYYLEEIEAPNGYNKLTDPIKVEIASKTGVITVDNTQITGTTVEVENKAGTLLPSTGGIGTTIFYVVGGGLMVAAAVLLVAKKRMENK